MAEPMVDRIAHVLRDIGIPVEFGRVDADAFLPAIAVRNGALIVDRDTLKHPGDMLHEAGHIAVTDPVIRPTLCEVASDPAEEMAAIAWSYAACLAIGLDPKIVFHADGYRGGGQALLNAFQSGGWVGTPMLAWYGMTGMNKSAAHRYPSMLRWLR